MAAKNDTKPKAEGLHIQASELKQSILLPLSTLQTNKGQISGVPANPRSINAVKYEKLKDSIREDPEMLSLRELLVYEHEGKYVIIGGNMRYRALKELGYKEGVCKILDPGTPTQKLRAIAIKDNNNYGEWDNEALANEWDPAELDKWGIDLPPDADVSEDEEAKDDNFNVAEAMPAKPKTQEGDIFMLGRHRLICGDSTSPETLSILMGGNKVDLLLTDPPYNVDYSSKNEALNAADKGNRVQKDIANDKMENQAFKTFLTDAWTAINPHLKPGGAFYIWHASTESLNFKLSVKDVGWDVKQELIWVKNNIVLGRQDYQWKHEPCLYGWKPGASHYFIPRRDQITVTEDEIDPEAMSKAELKEFVKAALAAPSTIIHEDKPLRSADHPTMKPVKLMGTLIRNSTRPGEIVLDTFGGSGTTLIATEQLGRTCYMVELDPCYCDVIIRRWEELTGNQAQRLGNFKNE